MAESTDEIEVEMSVGEPEIEIEDVYELMEKLKNHLQESKTNILVTETIVKNHIQESNRNISIMETVLEKIQTKILIQDQLNQTNESTEAEGLTSEKLSATAVKLMENIEGTLQPHSFRNFLMNETFGKPNPSVLPILRGFSWDLEGVQQQLVDFKKQLRSKHKEYQDERRKDQNLERRIDRLLENINREMNAETRDGRRQTSMENFVRSRP